MTGAIQVRPLLAAVLVLATVWPAQAATAVRVAGSNEIKLDPEKGSVRASLDALATVTGVKITGDSARLAEPAPAGPMTGTPLQLLKHVLRGQNYVVKTDASGKLSEIVLMSGARGPDPIRPAGPTPAGPTPVTATKQAPPASIASALANDARQQVRPGAAQIAQTAVPVSPPLPPKSNPSMTPTQSTGTPQPGPQSPSQQVTITPEMQAQIAASTQQAQGQLQVLIQQLKAACPTSQRC